jgi:ElaB/YqjD/DUF883 family membrane-anchored ribosome-binding protein
MQNRIDQLVSGTPLPKPHPYMVQAVEDAAANASHQLGGLAKKAEGAIARHPVVSLSIGLAIGATLGWLLKRK